MRLPRLSAGAMSALPESVPNFHRQRAFTCIAQQPPCLIKVTRRYSITESIGAPSLYKAQCNVVLTQLCQLVPPWPLVALKIYKIRKPIDHRIMVSH